MSLTLLCSHVPWSLRQRGHFSYCWNNFLTDCSDFPSAFTQCLCCTLGIWLTLCWTTFFVGFFSPFGKAYVVAFRTPPASSTLCQFSVRDPRNVTIVWANPVVLPSLVSPALAFPKGKSCADICSWKRSKSRMKLEIFAECCRKEALNSQVCPGVWNFSMEFTPP